MSQVYTQNPKVKERIIKAYNSSRQQALNVRSSYDAVAENAWVDTWMIQATKPLDDTHGKDRLLRNSQGAVAHNDGILPVFFLTCKHVPRTYTQRKFNLLDKFKAAIDFEDDNLKYPLVLDTNLVITLHYLLNLPNRPWMMDHYLIKYIKYKMVYNLDKGNLQNEEMYLTLGRNSRPEAAEFSSFDPTNS